MPFFHIWLDYRLFMTPYVVTIQVLNGSCRWKIVLQIFKKNLMGGEGGGHPPLPLGRPRVNGLKLAMPS